MTKVVTAIALNKNKFHIVNDVASLLDKNDKKQMLFSTYLLLHINNFSL